MDIVMDKKTPNAARLARYRAAHRRIDYNPSAASLDLIERTRAANPGSSYSRVVDGLLAFVLKNISGNAAGSR